MEQIILSPDVDAGNWFTRWQHVDNREANQKDLKSNQSGRSRRGRRSNKEDDDE
jgi:hypothetical protein